AREGGGGGGQGVYGAGLSRGDQRPAATPAMTTSRPAQTSGASTWLPVSMPHIAAETGAMPVSRPTRPARRQSQHFGPGMDRPWGWEVIPATSPRHHASLP